MPCAQESLLALWAAASIQAAGTGGAQDKAAFVEGQGAVLVSTVCLRVGCSLARMTLTQHLRRHALSADGRPVALIKDVVYPLEKRRPGLIALAHELGVMYDATYHVPSRSIQARKQSLSRAL